MPRQSSFERLITDLVRPIVEEVAQMFNRLRFEPVPVETGTGRYVCKVLKGDEDPEPATWELRESERLDKVVILRTIERTALRELQCPSQEDETIRHTVEYSLIQLANLKMRPRNLREWILAPEERGETETPDEGERR